MSSQTTSGDNQFLNVYHQPVQVPPSGQVMTNQFPQTFVCVQGPNGPMFIPMITQGHTTPFAPQQNQQMDTIMRELENVKAELAAQKALNEKQRQAVLSAVAPAGMAPLRMAPVRLPIFAQKKDEAPPPKFGSAECNSAPVIKQNESDESGEEETSWTEVIRRRSPATVETKLLEDKSPTTSKLPTIPTLDKQRASLCRFCPGYPEHKLGKCFNNNPCGKCHQFGHGTDFCKTPANKHWDPTRESKIENRWWTEVAEETITLCFKNADEEDSEIVIKKGYLLPHKHLCCAFPECNNDSCKRRFHLKA
jgi:hypothetical protein